MRHGAHSGIHCEVTTRLSRSASGVIPTLWDMPRTGAQNRGIRRERQVRKVLESEGYWVSRASGSLGDADLVALRRGSPPLLIEVKSTTAGPFSGFGPAERTQLLVAARVAGAEAWLVWWPSRGDARWLSPMYWPVSNSIDSVD